MSVNRIRMASKTNIKPLFDNVLIKPLEAETRTPSGIILPDSAKEKPEMGEIMAVGEGYHTPDGKVLPMTVKVGQKIMYGGYSHRNVKVNGEDWVIVGEKDILAVIG